MVYYNNEWHLAQLPPPVCPKCGSHRTQVVGNSDDGAAVVVRCASCGDRSRVDVGGKQTPESGSIAGAAIRA
jgi:hypothetical protein